MKKQFRLLPLPVKMVLIAAVPLIYTIFLTVQLIAEKAENIQLFYSYQRQTNDAQQMIDLIEDLQNELRASYIYVINRGQASSMPARRRETDSAIRRIESSQDILLRRFTRYTFLNNLPAARVRIDNGQMAPKEVTTCYLSAIFRLSSLNNITVPSNQHLDQVKREMNEQEVLSQMITYLVLMRSNIYNALYTHKDERATLEGLTNTYRVFNSYETELLTNGSAQTIAEYEALRTHSSYRSMLEELDPMILRLSFDGSLTGDQWWDSSGRALDELNALQHRISRRVSDELENGLVKEREARTGTLILLVFSLLLIAAVIVYTVYVISRMLTEIKEAAGRIAEGTTAGLFKDYPNDVIGSLADSISSIDKINQTIASTAFRIGKGDFSAPLEPRGKDDLLCSALLKMKEDLQKLNEQEKLRQQILTKAVLSAQEQERILLGAELHDNVNQLLTSVKLYIEFMEGNEEQRPALLSKSKQAITLAMEEIRKLSRKLVLPNLGNFDLVQSIEDLAQDLFSGTTIAYMVDISGCDELDLSEEFKIVLYRIVQEQLTNIVKHAEASRVSISIRHSDGLIDLRIADNGKGFDPHTRKRGVGLTSIRNRAQVFNGKKEIDSAPGNGCRLHVSFKTTELYKTAAVQ